MKHYQIRLEVVLSQLDDLTTKHSKMSNDERKEKLGHPRELIEKLHTACQSVKLTIENMPKIVERLESKRKLHEMCAQVILDTTQLEQQ